MCLKTTGQVANNVYPDQTPHCCCVSSESTLLTQACMSQYSVLLTLVQLNKLRCHAHFRGGNDNSTKPLKCPHLLPPPTKIPYFKSLCHNRTFYFSKKTSKPLNSANPLKILTPATFICQPIRLLDPGCWYKFIYWMTNSADPDQLASLKKPTDLDLHCLQRQGISGFSMTRVKVSPYLELWIFVSHFLLIHHVKYQNNVENFLFFKDY